MTLQLHWQLFALAFLVWQTKIGVESLKLERIINGSTATTKQFPYQVFFDLYSNFHWVPICGGAIISERVVLTAAHCFKYEFDLIKIYFGAVDKSNPKETGQQRLIVNRENVIVHPEWDSFQMINDIAIILLPADLQFNEYIQPAELPDPNETYENQEAVISGWGAIKLWQYPHVLQYYRGNILSPANCTRDIHKIFPGQIVPSSYICADTSVSTACFGDSGGPMVVGKEDGNRILVGLTSYGPSSCRFNSFNAYTRVSSFLNWIKKVGNL